MRALAWYRLGPIGLAIEFILEILHKLSGREIKIDFDARRTQENIAIDKMLDDYRKQGEKLKSESIQYSAMLEPEIQCKGCGNYHNLIRCPNCRRMNNAHSAIKKAEPVSFVASGSANLCKTFKRVDSGRERSFIDISTAHLTALQAPHIFDLTPHKSQGHE